MPTQYQVTCSKCDYKSDLIWLSETFYRRPSGDEHELAKQLVWCPSCSRVTFAEYLHSLKIMEQLLAIPHIKKGEASLKTGCQWSEAEIEAVRAYTRYPGYILLHQNVFCYNKWDIRQAMILQYKLKLHAKWRKARKSPAHCLTCGKTKFFPLPVDADENPVDTKHPGCGGTLKFIKKRTVKRTPYPEVWTPEGKYIGSGKPKTDY